MSGWIVALMAFATIGALWWRSQRQIELELERVARALDALGEGRKPANLVFLDRAAQGLAGRIERLAERQERREDEIRRGESNLKTVLGSMDEGVMVVDAQHVLKEVNPSFLRFFDVKGDPRGQTVLRTLRETVVEEMINAALATEERQTGEISSGGLRPHRHFAVQVVPVRDAESRQGAVTIFRDISRLRQLEDVRREFVANVSHELRTPLSIFHGYVENLLDEPDLPAKAQREIFEVLRKHSLRLNALLEDLLTLARLESRHDKLSLETLQLSEFVSAATGDLARRIGSKGIALQIKIPSDLPPLLADPMRLEQVFNNLLENAGKYTEKGGTITITASAAGPEIEVRVEDTGIGIPPADLPHIFERFFRADKARTRLQGGTGLGLAIVKHIVQAHGGSVRAESTYGKGTAIIFRLPIRTEPTAAAAAPGAPSDSRIASDTAAADLGGDDTGA